MTYEAQYFKTKQKKCLQITEKKNLVIPNVTQYEL